MINNVTGIILRKRDLGEKDLALTMISHEGERLEVIVKGAGGKSKRRSHLELMNLIRGTLYSSRTHSYLQSVECQNSFSTLKSSYETVFKLYPFLELIDRVLHLGDPQPEIYSILLETLEGLNQKDSDFLLEHSYIRLAHVLGFLPNFKECASCHLQIEDEAYWNSDAGTLHDKECSRESDLLIPLKYRKAMEYFRRAPFENKIVIHKDERKELNDLVTSLLLPHLDRPLKSL